MPAEKTGRVPVANVAKALFALQHAGLEGRMRITFELFDSDRSGRIDLQELYEILRVRAIPWPVNKGYPTSHRQYHPVTERC